MHQFMSAIWEFHGKVNVNSINGTVLIFRDSLEPDPDFVQSYYIQFSEMETFAVVPFDAEVKVNEDGGLIIPAEYVCLDGLGNRPAVLTFYQKAQDLDVYEHLNRRLGKCEGKGVVRCQGFLPDSLALHPVT